MTAHIPSHAAIVSQASYHSDDPYDIICSNIEFINLLLESYLLPDEIASDALRSYFVDYYLAQRNNGGFSQFVYNSSWDGQLVGYVREGLAAIGATQQLALFEECAALLDTLGDQRLQAFLESEYFGDNEERDFLSKLDDRFSTLEEQENILALNAAWLRSRPDLVVLPVAEMKREAKRRSQTIPNREQRIALAQADEPRYLQLIRALCEQAGYELSRVTAADPAHSYAGQRVVAWHFITDRGHHYMIEIEDKALMFQGNTHTCIAEIVAPDEEE